MRQQSAGLCSGCRGRIELERAVAQQVDTIEAVKYLLVMGHSDDRRLLFLHELAQEIHDNAGAFGIERGCRLVSKYDARLISECAGNGDPLRLAARQFL